MSDHVPQEGDYMIATHIEKVVRDFLDGTITGIAMCAVRSDGSPCRLYIDKKMKEPNLLLALEMLYSEIGDNRTLQAQSTAPFNNRSNRTH